MKCYLVSASKNSISTNELIHSFSQSSMLILPQCCPLFVFFFVQLPKDLASDINTANIRIRIKVEMLRSILPLDGSLLYIHSMKSLKIDLLFEKNVFTSECRNQRSGFHAWLQHLGSRLINQCRKRERERKKIRESLASM